MKHSFTRHYCSICQNVYCQKHTHYSPHGNLGSCGMESKCICQNCFKVLPKASQVGLATAGMAPPILDLLEQPLPQSCECGLGQIVQADGQDRLRNTACVHSACLFRGAWCVPLHLAGMSL